MTYPEALSVFIMNTLRDDALCALCHLQDHSIRPIAHVAKLRWDIWKIGSTIVLRPASCDRLLGKVRLLAPRDHACRLHINAAGYGIQH